MATASKTITGTYEPVVVPSSTEIYLQNIGSSKIEIYISDLAPLDNEVGIILYPKDSGTSLVLGLTETMYAKTEVASSTSTLVWVL